MPSELRTLKIPQDSEEEEEEDEDDYSVELGGSPLWQKASALLASKLWERLVMIMILVNITLMAAEAQYKEIRQRTKTCGWIELTFVVFFSFEIALRIFVQGCSGFFCDEDHEERRWNWGDFTIVALGLFALVIRPYHNGMHNPLSQRDDDDDWMSLVLLLRGLRIIRLIRLFKRLRQLHMLIRGMFKSFEAVFWILVLGLLTILIFAVSVTTIVGNHSDLWSQEKCSSCGAHDQRKIEELFGDLGDSMWTMFQFVTLDDWSNIIELVSKRLWVMKFFFLGYTLIASFALVSLLTGVMAEHIMSESQQAQKANGDEDITEYIDHLKRCFAARLSPQTASRGLTLSELSDLLSDPKVGSYLQRIGLDDAFRPEDVKDAFRAMDLNGDEMLTWEEFNKGLRSISGTASAKELALVRADVQRLLRLVQRTVSMAVTPRGPSSLTEDSFSRRLGSVEERMARLEGAVLQLVQAPKQGAQTSLQPQPLPPPPRI